MAGTTASGKLRPSSEGGGGKRAGRYVLGDLLGRGGMAEVFSGHVMGDHGFQKPVAIKRLLPELANDKIFVERLIQEAKLLVGLQHGNIVSVLDLARDGEDVFLVMDFVDGPSLRQLLKARGTRGLPLGVAAYVVQMAAAGLEFAHARPGGAIIHADISPSNLLLTTSGEVRVADFGIARRENTGQGVVEGKWAYMAPEQARGEGLAPRCDVFALGVVLYELITGAHPFGRQVTADERESEPMRVIPPRVVRPSVPHGLDAICMKALSHDPRDRYQRMQQIVDALTDERFANQWRDGASELAQAIREVVPAASPNGSVGPRTMVTDRPVTIVTRSLIEVTPHKKSAPRLAEVPASPAQLAAEAANPFGPLDSGARTLDRIDTSSVAAEVSASAPSASASQSAQSHSQPGPMPPTTPFGPVPGMSPGIALNGQALPGFRMPDAHLPAQDLASVHGGTAHSVHVAAAPAGESARSNKWPILVLGGAAVMGVIAAIVLQLAPAEVDAAAKKPAPVAKIEQPAPAPTLSVEPIAPPTPAPVAVAPAPAPAPAPVVTESAPAPAPVVTESAPAPTAEVATTTPTVAPAKTQRSARAAPKREPGILRLGVRPWGWVSVDGGPQRDGNGAKFALAPGRHSVKVWNDVGDHKEFAVTIEPTKMKNVKVSLEDLTVEEKN